MNPLHLILSGLAFLIGGGLSARWNWWRPSNKGLPILMYHKIGDPPSGSKLKKLWVSSKMLRRQMAYLSEEGYHPVTFRDIYDAWDGIKPLLANPVLITFDDGYMNNYTEAFPILRDFGFRATLFVVVQTVGWDNHWHDPQAEARIPMVSWAQLKELQNAGWEIGSHSMNHPNLTKLEIKEVAIESEKSRRIIGEFLDVIPQTFAYPYGAGEDDESIREAVKNAGYRIALGIHAGKGALDQMKMSPYHLPRIFVRGDETMFDFHLQITRGKSRF